jgi:tRNA nucleotidyltransferase (CCA-adding enzyme)
MYIPTNVKFIIDEIYKQGYEAFIVGGCVRDSILGLIPNDYDITTNAKTYDIKEIFKSFKLIETGIKHGTIGVIIDEEIYEITTYRIEGEYEDFRRPKEVKFAENILDDLKRRDFTINAMAYNDKVGLIDKFNGKVDLEKKIIKTVGDANERFNEDALRMVRAIRFSATLNFEIDDFVFSSICKNSDKVKNISVERITDEVKKILFSKNIEKLNLLFESKIFQNIGIYDYKNFDEKKLNILNNKNFSLEEKLLLLEYILSFESGYIYYEENIKNCSIVNTLRFSKKTTNYVNDMIKYMYIDLQNDKVWLKYLLNEIGVKNLKNIINLRIIYNNFCKKDVKILEECLREILEIEKNCECYSKKELKINGKMLLDLGYCGKEIGDNLDFLLHKVIENPNLNEKNILIKLL